MSGYGQIRVGRNIAGCANVAWRGTFRWMNVMDYLLLIVFWSLWCMLHSGMIASRVTDDLKVRLGNGYRYYRLVFNIVSVVTLVPLLIFGRRVDALVLYEFHGLLLWLKWVMLAVAAVLLTLGALKYDILALAGIRQLRSGHNPAVISKTGDIDATGILGLTRHPLYLGALFLIWSDDGTITVASLIVDLILTVYIVWGTILEERKLVAELGDAYRDYQKRVPMLFPMRRRPKRPV
jgi:protein-S-isoprenylcysteine O-methyltransferase Ste14